MLASTSGGSGGDAGVGQLRNELPHRLDAAIVLGDLGGSVVRRPMVIPFSDGQGSAPLVLARTVEDAIKDQGGIEAGAPSALGQLVHLMVPLTVGEQGVLDREGVPAVLAQVSGERGPSRNEPINPERLEALGRSVLSAVDALDTAPDVTQARQNGIVLQRQQMPQWAVRLLVVMLILPVLAAGIDGLARARRWHLRPGRWALWTLSCALPFAATALLARLLGMSGLLGAGPRRPAAVRGAEIRSGVGGGPGAARGLLRGVLVRLGSHHPLGRLGHAPGAGDRRPRDRPGGGGAGVGGVGDQPLHRAAARARRARVAPARVARAPAPPAAGVDRPARPGRAAARGSGGVLLPPARARGGRRRVGGRAAVRRRLRRPLAVLLWSVGFGCGVSSLLLALVHDVPTGSEHTPEPVEVTIRGP